MLLQVSTPALPAKDAFVAGMVLDDETGYVVATAPILRWARGKHFAELRPYFRKRRWTVIRIS
jgi:hypothetical protein